jgi:predicted enzyme related to lactoylglutathione lyase
MSTQRNPVGWFEIYVNDMARAKAFYEAVLGIKLQPLANPTADGAGLEMWAFPFTPDGPGCGGALCKMDGCADCAVEASRVEAAGGRVYKEKFAIGEYGFIAIAADTEGNTIGLHSMV